MTTMLLVPDDRSPEDRLRDAYDDAEIERMAEEAAALIRRHRYRAWFTPMRICLLALTALWAGTIWHIADVYSPRVGWLCVLCTAWGITIGFLLTFDWVESGRDRSDP